MNVALDRILFRFKLFKYDGINYPFVAFVPQSLAYCSLGQE